MGRISVKRQCCFALYKVLILLNIFSITIRLTCCNVLVVKWMLRRSFQLLGCLSLVTKSSAVASVCCRPAYYYSKMAGEKDPLVGVKYLR